MRAKRLDVLYRHKTLIDTYFEHSIRAVELPQATALPLEQPKIENFGGIQSYRLVRVRERLRIYVWKDISSAVHVHSKAKVQHVFLRDPTAFVSSIPTR